MKIQLYYSLACAEILQKESKGITGWLCRIVTYPVNIQDLNNWAQDIFIHLSGEKRQLWAKEGCNQLDALTMVFSPPCVVMNQEERRINSLRRMLIDNIFLENKGNKLQCCKQTVKMSSLNKS